MKTILRNLLRFICYFYCIDYGRYSIVQRLYLKYLIPKKNKIITTKICFGISMKLNITEYIQSFLYLFRSYELLTEKFFKRIVNKNDYILDIGANVGYLSMIFATLTGNKGIVVSFEPEPNNFQTLTENKKLNGFSQIITEQLGVSDSNGTFKLFLSNDANNGKHSLIFDDNRVTSKYMEINTIIIDEYLKNNNINRIDIVKIDVEGFEKKVLNGMRNTLQEHKPVLFIELIDLIQQSTNESSISIINMLNDEFGYIHYKLLKNGFLEQYFGSHVWSENVVFIHKSKIEKYKHLIKPLN